MIALGIFVILFTVFNVWYNIHLDKKLKADGKLTFLFMSHAVLGVFMLTFFLAIEEKNTPKAIDVYRGNTELEIHSINNIPQDTVVIWKGGIEK
jgi:hypothetical protein